jgi:two-component system alkaline phosphatase synthesis response regulator PhoP
MEGYDVTVACNGRVALEEAEKKRFDLVILDVMLPELDGFQVCRTLRMRNKQMPILFLSAKSSSSDRVQGLKIGGDDYLPKPFNLEELLLRVKNLIRRGSIKEKNKSDKVFNFSNNSINFSSYEILGQSGEKSRLSKREIMLLKLFIDREGEVVSREEILENIWGYDVYPSTRTIDNYILVFRKYFEKEPKSPQHFISIRGVGYKFNG